MSCPIIWIRIVIWSITSIISNKTSHAYFYLDNFLFTWSRMKLFDSIWLDEITGKCPKRNDTFNIELHMYLRNLMKWQSFRRLLYMENLTFGHFQQQIKIYFQCTSPISHRSADGYRRHHLRDEIEWAQSESEQNTNRKKPLFYNWCL